jgi:hypothetical protein
MSKGAYTLGDCRLSIITDSAALASRQPGEEVSCKNLVKPLENAEVPLPPLSFSRPSNWCLLEPLQMRLDSIVEPPEPLRTKDNVELVSGRLVEIDVCPELSFHDKLDGYGADGYCAMPCQHRYGVFGT